MTKPRMLYLMHIDWNWIRQRPQYLEDELEKSYDITVFCPRNYRLKEYRDKDNISVFYTIPFIRRYPYVARIDDWRKKKAIEKIIKKSKPEYIYSTSPEFSYCIPQWYKGCVIYDCMDNMIAFHSNQRLIERVADQESAMVHRADIILASSQKLCKILDDRYGELSKGKISLIRNGYDGKLENTDSASPRKKRFTLCYFGTIGRWFNFTYILKSLKEEEDIEYLLIGPVECGTSIPKHNRIKHLPPVDHSKLFDITKNTDAFIMPFEINELILSVDPVKLYEYINFNKNILCVEYPEVERFGHFVYFYSDYESFKAQICRLKKEKSVKYTNEERILFLEKNNWKERGKQITELIIQKGAK